MLPFAFSRGDTLTSRSGFSNNRTLPADEGEDDRMELGDPQLIDSGELVSSTIKPGILAAMQAVGTLEGSWHKNILRMTLVHYLLPKFESQLHHLRDVVRVLFSGHQWPWRIERPHRCPGKHKHHC